MSTHTHMYTHMRAHTCTHTCMHTHAQACSQPGLDAGAGSGSASPPPESEDSVTKTPGGHLPNPGVPGSLLGCCFPSYGSVHSCSARIPATNDPQMWRVRVSGRGTWLAECPESRTSLAHDLLITFPHWRRWSNMAFPSGLDACSHGVHGVDGRTRLHGTRCPVLLGQKQPDSPSGTRLPGRRELDGENPPAPVGVGTTRHNTEASPAVGAPATRTQLC